MIRCSLWIWKTHDNTQPSGNYRLGQGRVALLLIHGNVILTIQCSQTSYISQLLFACSITTTKISILFFYHRIFPSRTFTRISIVIGCVSIAWWLSLVFSIIFSCKPVNYFWNKSNPNGHCLDENTLAYGITGANIVTDILVLCLPFPWLWRLQMPMSRKLLIIGMFALGGL